MVWLILVGTIKMRRFNMIVINFFGGPGNGKSTGAAYVFSQLKMAGVNAELVTEFAKDKVYEETKEVWNCQEYIFGKQSFKLKKLKEKKDVVVTDSPLFLSVLYNNDDVLGGEFNTIIKRRFDSYDNHNYFVNRVKPYNPSGRLQDESGADDLSDILKTLMKDNGIDYAEINGDIYGYNKVVNDILELLNQN